MPDLTGIEAVIDTAQHAVEPHGLDLNHRLHTVIVPAGAALQVIDVEKHLDTYRDQPRRKTGTVATFTAATFVGYFAKHHGEWTEVWADDQSQTLTAVFNAHGPTAADVDPNRNAGWGDHRATLTLRKTPAWAAWQARDRTFMPQEDFAELVEERLIDFADPAGAVMLELAQTFKATTKVDFESTRRLKSGETTIEYREATEATAGKKGTVAVPDTFTLALQPFEGSDAYRVPVRFRYRIRDSRLTLGYVIERPEELVRSAFADVCEFVGSNIDVDIWSGKPGT